MAEKSIGGYIRDISKEVQDERMSRERESDEAERVIDNPRAFIIHCDCLIRSHCIGPRRNSNNEGVPGHYEESVGAGSIRDAADRPK